MRFILVYRYDKMLNDMVKGCGIAEARFPDFIDNFSRFLLGHAHHHTDRHCSAPLYTSLQQRWKKQEEKKETARLQLGDSGIEH